MFFEIQLNFQLYSINFNREKIFVKQNICSLTDDISANLFNYITEYYQIKLIHVNIQSK